MTAVSISHSPRVARVTLDRPPLNVIDLGTARELSVALEDLIGRDDLCAVVLEGKGRAFCAGVDVRDHLPDRGAEMIHQFHRACLALSAIAVPTVAVVHGPALGGGSELTLMCDLVWAGESASFGFPEIRLGVFPPVAAAALPAMIPAHLAAELILTGRAITALEAERFGLVNRVTRDVELEESVGELLSDLSRLSPASLRATKRALEISRQRPAAEAIERAERFYLENFLQAPDAVEGLTAFMEKRKPAWSVGR